MIIDDKLLNGLLEEAKLSERFRQNLDLRNDISDQSQRMLNALLPGTIVPIHRHRNTIETVIILSGTIEEVFYNENGSECERFILNPIDGIHGMQIPICQWHTVVVKEPAVIVEMKDGMYFPLEPEDILSSSNCIAKDAC